jgi:site-specific recombinase XerD
LGGDFVLAGRWTSIGYTFACSNRPGSNRKRRPKLQAGERYETGEYANCVRRACDLADRRAHKADPSIDYDERIVPRWTPNQLRHSMATEVRRRYGLEAVQVVLGHATANVTQIYAELDLGLAARIMREVG